MTDKKKRSRALIAMYVTCFLGIVAIIAYIACDISASYYPSREPAPQEVEPAVEEPEVPPITPGTIGTLGEPTQLPFMMSVSAFSGVEEPRPEPSEPYFMSPGEYEEPWPEAWYDPTDFSEPFVYEVVKGDCLWSIAEYYYGYGAKYPYICKTNYMSYIDALQIGTALIIYPLDWEFTEEEWAEMEEVYKTINDKKGRLSMNVEGLEYIGDFYVTGYDPWCSHCNGKSHPNGITASGKTATIDYTVAFNKVPLGTTLYVEGYGYFMVEDRTSKTCTNVDIARTDHQDCYANTSSGRVEVYKVVKSK